VNVEVKEVQNETPRGDNTRVTQKDVYP